MMQMRPQIVREHDSSEMATRINAGLHEHQAAACDAKGVLHKQPACRGLGTFFPVYDIQGQIIPECDNRHPFGPRKRKYLREDFACTDSEPE